MPRLPDIVEMVSQLIALPSVSSHDPRRDMSNRPVIDLLATWAESAGGRCQILDVPGHPGKANLLATFGPRDAAKPAGLVLAGHTDTVPCDPAAWSTDPFTATRKGARLYGLGATDMKGFLALALQVAAGLNPNRLRHPLAVLATADEESGMYGARALQDAGRLFGRRVIIGEPTSGRPVRLHKGVMMEALTLQGKSGHSSRPAAGANAIDGLHAALGALGALRTGWVDRFDASPFADVPEPTLSFGHVHGGDAPNRICGTCRLDFDVRLVPGMDPDGVRQALARAVNGALHGSGVTASWASLGPPIPPFECPADAPLVRAVEAVTQTSAGAVLFGTEAPFFAALGMEVVVMGPGSIDMAHLPDEFLPLDELAPMAQQLATLAERFCGADAPPERP